MTTRPSGIGLSTTVGLGQGCFRISQVGKDEQAVNDANNNGLFRDMAPPAAPPGAPALTQRARRRGPLSYADLAARIRGLVAVEEAMTMTRHASAARLVAPRGPRGPPVRRPAFAGGPLASRARPAVSLGERRREHSVQPRSGRPRSAEQRPGRGADRRGLRRLGGDSDRDRHARQRRPARHRRRRDQLPAVPLPAAPDGLCAIVFDEDGEIFDLLFGPDSGVLGFAGPEWLNTATGRSSKASLHEWRLALGTDPFPLDEFLSVQVHEFGHYQNLAHTVVNGQIALWRHHRSDAEQHLPRPATFAGRIETMYPFLFAPAARRRRTTTTSRSSRRSIRTRASRPGPAR